MKKKQGKKQDKKQGDIRMLQKITDKLADTITDVIIEAEPERYTEICQMVAKRLSLVGTKGSIV